ncbi:hypothetical protein HY990_00175 [Candidatus Micrarchaeota archaeon]|nr:hypothetical protein [Candidatus Micrarchaeota archaeon]
MARRGTGEVAEKLLSILSNQSETRGGFSVQDIATKSEINWETTKRYLEMFCKLNVIIELKDGDKVLYQKVGQDEKDTLFGIPLSQNNRITIQKIYATIRLLWKEKHDIPIYKTLLQKVAVDVVETRFPQIPSGWYLYGKLLPLASDSEDGTPFDNDEDIEATRKALETYSSCTNTHEIRLLQYRRKEQNLYIVKEQLATLLSGSLTKDITLFQSINEFAMQVEKTENNEKTKAIAEAFAASILSICRNSDEKQLFSARPAIIDVFNRVWELIATCEYHESMKQFYDEEILDYYMSSDIVDKEELSLEALESLEPFEPKLNLKDNEQMRKLKALQGAGKDLSPEEKKKREKNLENMAASDLFRAHGIDQS